MTTTQKFEGKVGQMGHLSLYHFSIQSCIQNHTGTFLKVHSRFREYYYSRIRMRIFSGNFIASKVHNYKTLHQDFKFCCRT